MASDDVKVIMYISLDISDGIEEYMREIAVDTGIVLCKTEAIRSLLRKQLNERKKQQ